MEVLTHPIHNVRAINTSHEEFGLSKAIASIAGATPKVP
jgi:hypothetical protein